MFILTSQRTSKILLFFLIIIYPVYLNAQIQYGGDPLAKELVLPKSIDDTFLKTITLTEEQEILRRQIIGEPTPSGQAMKAGFSIPVHYNPEVDGSWINLGDSLWVWRLMINIERAGSIGLVMKNFEMGENSRMFIYNENVDFVVGSISHKNNNPQQLLSVQAIPGETIIIEYQEKKEDGYEKFYQSDFQITELIYIVNGLNSFTEKGLGDSDECMININCSEGDDWQIQKRGVARLLMKSGNSWYWCSGSLINNTRQNGDPYLLTADHCGVDASFFDRQVWQFYFNFERPGCTEMGAPSHNVLFGCDLTARGPMDGGSDFKLIHLHRTPPIHWRPFYNGWDINDMPSLSGVGIHHPSGDAKKISTFDGGVVSGGGSFTNGENMAPNSAWRFSFTATENGFSVTQGGSSGSPMFNQNGLIVGTLSGGSSSCSNPLGVNIYGKMSYHWESNENIPALQLKPHLDPLNLGVSSLNGYDPYIQNYPPPGFISSSFADSETVKINWYKPGQAPNHEGWHSYASSYVGYSNEGPERVTVFSAEALGFNYPVSVSHLSHVFIETETEPWDNNLFTFRIYDSNGFTILYSSPTLTAESLTEVIYELDSVLTFEDKFYVSVRSIHPSGHPSSAYNLTNEGNTYSYHGHSTTWIPSGNSTHQFVYLTGIYVEGDFNKTVDFTTIPDKWSNLPINYNLYKNDELLFVLENEIDSRLEYFDFLEENTDAFIKYHVTAMYDDIESPPSNSTYVFLQDNCQEQISSFPFIEIFDDSGIPECWSIEGIANNSWEISQGYTVFDTIAISPLIGGNFLAVKASDSELQDEWIITPSFDISQLELTALKFYFNGNYTSSNIDNNAQLNVYLSYHDNSFIKIWDSSDSPVFNSNTSHTWIPVTINLTEFNLTGTLRIGFQYTGTDGVNFGIDKIEIIDASEETYILSLDMFPLESGEVYGSGSYLDGEAVNINAYANNTYFFHYWVAENDTLTSKPDYSFVMPGSDYHITANFTLENTTSVADAVIDSGKTKIYPNPSKGNIILQLKDNSIQNVRINIFNASGSLIKEVNTEGTPVGERISIDLSTQPPGFYIAAIEYNETIEVHKISIQP